MPLPVDESKGDLDHELHKIRKGHIAYSPQPEDPLQGVDHPAGLDIGLLLGILPWKGIQETGRRHTFRKTVLLIGLKRIEPVAPSGIDLLHVIFNGTLPVNDPVAKTRHFELLGCQILQDEILPHG